MSTPTMPAAEAASGGTGPACDHAPTDGTWCPYCPPVIGPTKVPSSGPLASHRRDMARKGW